METDLFSIHKVIKEVWFGEKKSFKKGKNQACLLGK